MKTNIKDKESVMVQSEITDEDIDCTVRSLCTCIQHLSADCCAGVGETTLPMLTTALADLISARAKLLKVILEND